MSKKEKRVFKKEGFTELGVYAGSLANLEQIDLSFLNVRFIKIKSPELNKFSKQVKHKTFPSGIITHLEEFNDSWFSSELYLLVPIDLSKSLDYELLIEIQNLFLVMFPSDFRLYAEVHCQLFDDKYLYPNGDSIWGFRSTGEKLYDNFMNFDKEVVSEINEFSRLLFERKKSINYINLTIDSYLNALFQPHLAMALVSLCISLESITDGHSELLYRIRRNCAILNGSTKERAWTIFKNVEKFYSLRSTIVHGDKYDWKKVEEYYPKLRSLASRTIIELISINIQTREELNKKITEASFGSKELLSQGYKNYILDIDSLVSVILPIIEKPKKQIKK